MSGRCRRRGRTRAHEPVTATPAYRPFTSKTLTPDVSRVRPSSPDRFEPDAWTRPRFVDCRENQSHTRPSNRNYTDDSTIVSVSMRSHEGRGEDYDQRRGSPAGYYAPTGTRHDPGRPSEGGSSGPDLDNRRAPASDSRRPPAWPAAQARRDRLRFRRQMPPRCWKQPGAW